MADYNELDEAGLDELENALMNAPVEEPVTENEDSTTENIDSTDNSNDVDDTETSDDLETETDTDNETEDDLDEDELDEDTDTEDDSEEKDAGTNHAIEDEDESDDIDDGQESAQDSTNVEDGDEPAETIDTEEFKRLQDFYRKVTETEIVVNGVKTKPLSDPEKILKAQQASGGLAKKFAAIKEARPVVEPLKKRGLLQDTEQFDLLMRVNDGDPEAIKELLRKQEIDPMELDMDEIKYERTPEASSEVDLMFNDALDIGEQYGVKERMQETIIDKWDDDAKRVFFSDPSKAQSISNALAEQMSNGIYDRVISVAEQMKMTDVSGRYTNMNAIDMYNEASKIVNVELQKEYAEQQAQAESKPKVDKTKVEEEKAKIKAKREKEEYTAKAKAQEAKVNKARKVATKVSKTKQKAAPAKKYNPLTLEGDELDLFEKELMELYR
jgi:hypothetical protein